MSFYDVLSALGALLIIVLMLFLTYYGSRWYARRMGGIATGKHIKIIDRAQLGGNAYVAIVQAGGKFYLIGVSEKRMELISELTDFDPPSPMDSQDKPLPFGQILAGLLEKTRGKNDKEGEQ